MPAPFWDKEEFRYKGNELDDNGLSRWNATYLDEKLDASFAWNVCFIERYRLPGIVAIKAQPHRRVDRKLPPHSNREKITVTGYTPADVEITVTMWTPDQWRVFQSVRDAIWQPPTKSSDDDKAFNIDSVQLSWLNINRIKIVSMSTLMEGSERGVKVAFIKALEYVDVPAVPEKTPNKRTKATNVNAAKPIKDALANIQDKSKGHQPNPKPTQNATEVGTPTFKSAS